MKIFIIVLILQSGGNSTVELGMREFESRAQCLIVAETVAEDALKMGAAENTLVDCVDTDNIITPE